jgi:hypothetical protein
MKHYRVSWDIDVEAHTPTEAARAALNIMTDSIHPDFWANVFTVVDSKTNKAYIADLGTGLTEER